jgi:ABC-type Fe3+/spermidine/putrescine transport system ATPase subunit
MRPHERLLFFIRPNDIDLFPPDYAGGENTFDGVVSKMTYLGDKIDYRIAVGGLELRVQTDGKVRFKQGESVRLRLPVDRCRAIGG